MMRFFFKRKKSKNIQQLCYFCIKYLLSMKNPQKLSLFNKLLKGMTHRGVFFIQIIFYGENRVSLESFHLIPLTVKTD